MSVRAARRLLAGALAALIALAVASSLAGGEFAPFNSQSPDSESARAQRALARASGVDPYFGLAAVVPSEPRVLARAQAAIDAEPGVAEVRRFEGPDPRVTYVVAGLEPSPLARQLDTARRVEERLSFDPRIELGGRAAFYANGNDTAEEDLLRADLMAAPFLLVLAMVAFRGLVAALVALGVAGVAMAATFLALRLIAPITEVSIYALNITNALGLGLAIDYSLLLVYRYREEVARTGPGTAALGRAVARARRTVATSSVTVVGAGLSLLVFPQPFLRSLGAGMALVAAIAAAAALVLLPAAIALLGERIDALAPRRLRAAAEAEAQPASSGFWRRTARLVMHRPALVACLGSVLLLAAAAPALGLELTQVDPRVVPEGSEDRRVAEQVAREGLAGEAAPVLLAIEGDRATATAARERLEELPPTAGAVLGPRPAGSGVWRIDVVPRPQVGPLSAQSEALVEDARALTRELPVLVGGESAALVDLRGDIEVRLPLCLAILALVVLASVWLATGSVVLPVKTLLMAALTVAAALGITTVIFQTGALEGLLGYTSTGSLEASVVVLTAAIAFALTTDYGVFLLRRIREARAAGASDGEAVALGLERSGRVVTWAAVLLCAALLSLVFARHALVKQVGVGAALAVLLDATVMRALLVPALMRLLGGANWWAPGFLRRFVSPPERRPLLRPSDPRRAEGAEFLAPTRYCDSQAVTVRALCDHLTGDAGSEREAAVRLYRFVRDEIPYAFGPWGVRASQTLARGTGTCTNKANLLVALLRAAGIGAAYGVLRVDTQHYFGPIGPDFLTRRASRSSVHVHAATRIDGRWLKCDPSTDADLASRTCHFCLQTRLIGWDGTEDSTDFLDPAHVHADLGLYADVDELLDRPARGAGPELFAAGNAYLDFVRSRPVFASAEELIGAYRRELDGEARSSGRVSARSAR